MNVLWCKVSKKIIFNINNCECNKENPRPETNSYNHIWITEKQAEEKLQNSMNRVYNIVAGCYHEN